MRINEFNLADSAAPWEAAGFTVVDGYVSIGRSFRFKLSATGGSGVLDFTFGDASRSSKTPLKIDGLTTYAEGIPAFLQDPLVQHPNSIIGAMKAVIKSPDTDVTTAQLLAELPELEKPDVSDTFEGSIRVDYWTSFDDVHLEVYCPNEEVSTNSIATIILFANDLDLAIAAFGKDNVSEKSVYLERDIVWVAPKCGLSPPLGLISYNLR